MSIEWAAGLFEGGGSVTLSGTRRRLQVKTVQEESVRRFCAVIGCGKVYGPYSHNSGDRYPRNPYWLWVAETEDADVAVELLLPLVSEWRQEAMRRLFPHVVETRRRSSRSRVNARGDWDPFSRGRS